MANTVEGSYNKLLLLQPNTSGNITTDNVSKAWSENTSTRYQPEDRKYWDPTYASTLMDQVAGFAYNYCHQLTLGGVPKGTWHLPTETQLQTIWSVYGGMKIGGFAEYTAFATNYWSCTEHSDCLARDFFFGSGASGDVDKSAASNVRCVRDL